MGYKLRYKGKMGQGKYEGEREYVGRLSMPANCATLLFQSNKTLIRYWFPWFNRWTREISNNALECFSQQNFCVICVYPNFIQRAFRLRWSTLGFWHVYHWNKLLFTNFNFWGSKLPPESISGLIWILGSTVSEIGFLGFESPKITQKSVILPFLH